VKRPRESQVATDAVNLVALFEGFEGRSTFARDAEIGAAVGAMLDRAHEVNTWRASTKAKRAQRVRDARRYVDESADALLGDYFFGTRVTGSGWSLTRSATKLGASTADEVRHQFAGGLARLVQKQRASETENTTRIVPMLAKCARDAATLGDLAAMAMHDAAHEVATYGVVHPTTARRLADAGIGSP